MRGVSFLGVLVAGLIVGYIYKTQYGGSGATAVAPVRQTIDVVGVKNDLIGIAHAEREYMVQNGKYTSLEALTSSGTLTMLKPSRDGYTYEVSTEDQNFHAIAHCPKSTMPGCTDFAIDSTMEVQLVH
jgi:hypothetical protein